MVKKTAATAANVPEALFGNIDQIASPTAVFAPAPDDLIDDVLDAVLKLAPSFCAALAQHRDQLAAMALAISQEKHQEYGGEQFYIAKTPEASRRQRSQRNAAILRDHQAGERMMLLERRYKLSKQAIWKIINSKG